ncbi:MAG TPA: hypothetical protein VEU96_10090 [Bryobacteraceae bacterium]|nr:hypothetical protein [Bryobacteraceae bacterium]
MTEGHSTLLFPLDFDERAAWEMELKGFVCAAVKLANGTVLEVTFYDPVRLAQDLEDEGYIADPGLIVIRSVTLQCMRDAVEKLQKSGYFERLVPLTEAEARRFQEIA